MAIHTAYIGPVQVDTVGNIHDKSTASIGVVASTTQEMRVLYDATYAPNGINNPTIEAYLVLEDTAGFVLKAITTSIIVTQEPIP